MANTKITSRVIADDAVLTANIADDAVTSAKLDTNIAIAGTLDVGGDAKFTNSGATLTQTLFADSGSSEGRANITFNTDGASADQSVANIRMQQGSGDGAARKGEIHFQVSDNGAPATAMSISNNRIVTFGSIISAADGSVTAPSYRGTDTNTGVFFPSGGVTAISRNGVEGMRMNADGVLLVGATATGRTTAGHEQHPSGFARHTRSGDKALELVRTSSDGEVFEIFKDTTLKQIMGTASNSIFSDKKVKKDIKSLELGLDLIKKLNPTEYRHILDDEDSPKSFGLIAQEFEKSLEEIGVEKNSTYLLQHKPSKGDTNSDYWLDYLKLTPVLIKAIQELSAEVEELKAKLESE